MTLHLPGSLASAFIPPQGYVGEFGWVCGFSGDAEFLNLAADRFSAQSKSQRAAGGRIVLGVMLDPCTPQVAPLAAPGVLHIPARRGLPWTLLHAKVALLGFGVPEGDNWCLRLVVSTGNWTRHTLGESLDLVWTLDLFSREATGEAAARARSDIRAAADLLREVRKHFIDHALTSPDTLSRAAINLLDARVAGLPSSANDPTPRFLDNREASLARAVTARVPKVAGAVRRNRLVIGSGFYGSGASPTLPVAAAAVVKELREAKILTNDPEITLVVNPGSCQEVASAGAHIKKARWHVLPAADPAGGRGTLRSLHAKFIFCANDMGNGTATSPWLYLGSGNLTAPGFLNRAGPAGNLEAGVVFAIDPLAWNDVRKRLPVDMTAADLALNPDSLQAGAGAPDRIPEYFAPPFAYLELSESPLAVRPPGDGTVSEVVEILGPSGAWLAPAVDGSYPWDGAAPAEVRVGWSADGARRTAVVAVLDRFGRLAGKALPPLDFIDLEEEIRSFPNPPEVDDDDEDTGGTYDVNGPAGPAVVRGSAPSNYPIREMMRAIETIAARQTAVPEAQWPAWCARVEQALVRMKESPPVASVRALGVNPLAVLRRSEFRPDFAAVEHHDRRYEAALGRVEAAWRYQNLTPLGGLT